MPDFTNPLLPKPGPTPSQVTMASISIPTRDPRIQAIPSTPLANGDTAASAAQIRDFILGGPKVVSSQTAPTPLEGILTPYSQAKRYNDPSLGFNPFRDNEDLYAKEQGVMASLGAGAGRLGLTTLTKLGTGIGYLGGMVESAIDPTGRNRYGGGIEGWLANAGDNALAYQFEKWEDNVKNDLFPIYQEASDQGKGFFSRALTDLNFWTEDVSDGLAFMASALAPGIALSKAGIGAKALSSLAKAYGYTDEAIDATRAATLFGGQVAEGAIASSAELNAVPRMLRIAANAKLARNVDVGLQTFVSTASEAMFEANETKNQVYQTLLAQGMDPEEASHQSAIAARDTYAMNLAALSFSNLWEANLIFKKLAPSANSELGKATREGLFGATRFGPKESALKAIAKDALKGVGVEGFYEENIQLAIQRLNESNPTASLGEKFLEVAERTARQTVGALSGQDTEAATSIGLGGLIGAGMGGVSSGVSRLGDERRRQAAQSRIDSYGTAFKALKDVYNADGTINEEGVAKFVQSQKNVLELMDLVDIAEENQLGVLKDVYESELFSEFAHAHFQAGQANLLLEKLSTVDKLSSEDLQSLGFDAASKEGAVIKIQALKQQAVQLQALYDNIQKEVVDTGRKISNDPKAPTVYDIRKEELYRLGARSITLSQQAQRVQTEIDLLNANNPTLNPLAEELNKRQNKINALVRAKDKLDDERAFGESNVGYYDDIDNQIQTLRKELAAYIAENEPSMSTLRKGEDELYSSKETDNESILNRRQRRIAELKLAEIEISKQSVDERFERIANPRSGDKFVRDQYARIVESRNPKPTQRTLRLTAATTPDQYTTYETGRLRRQRISSALGDITRETTSELLISELPNSSLEDINSLIDNALDQGISFSNEDKRRIEEALGSKIDDEINHTQMILDHLKDQLDELTRYGPEEMYPEELDRLDFVQEQIPIVEEKFNALQNMKGRSASIALFTPQTTTENLLRRQIADEYMTEPKRIISDLEQSEEGYDTQGDLDLVNSEIAQLEALRTIFVDRADVTDTSEFNGFIAGLNEAIEGLREAAINIEARMANRNLADQRAFTNYVNSVANTLGIDRVANTTNKLYTTISALLHKLYQAEYAKLAADLEVANKNNDTKGALYQMEAMQQLLKLAVSDPNVRNQFQADIDEMKGVSLGEFMKQRALNDIKKGGVSDETLLSIYSKSPQNIFRRIIDRAANQADLDDHNSAVYKYLQNYNLTEFLRNIQNEDRSGKVTPVEDFVDITRAHIDYLSLTNTEKVINSALPINEEVDNELSIIDKSIGSKDPDVLVITPSNEQLIALRELASFVFTPWNKVPFSNIGYLKGAAGTGKSGIIAKWLLKIARISKNDVLAIGHNVASSNNINGILGKGDISPQKSDLISALKNNTPIKIVIIDEIGGFSDADIVEIGEALDNYNKANQSNLKIITLGDPNQLNIRFGALAIDPAIESVIFTEKAQPFFGRLNNITYITPLTIRYRSDISQVNNFADKFIAQKRDLSNEDIIAKSTNPRFEPDLLKNSDLYGVAGTQNFTGFLQQALPILSTKQDGRTRAIITTPDKVEQYKNTLNSLNVPLTDVEVLSYIDAQGRTISEVYVDIPFSKKEFDTPFLYNKAMYVATSRAADFILVSNYNIQNEQDPLLGEEKVSKQADIKASAEVFKNDRTEEKKVLDTLPKAQTVTKTPEAPVTIVTPPTPPVVTKKTGTKEGPVVTNLDFVEAEGDPEENPAPVDIPEEEEVRRPLPETPVDTQTETIHNLKFPTSEAAENIVVFEGEVTPSYVSPRALVQLQKREVPLELRSDAVSIGDKVHYVPIAGKNNIFYMLVSPLKNASGKVIPNRWRQIGVLSDEEMENMKNDPDQRPIYDKLNAYASDPNSKTNIADLDRHEFTINNLISVVDGEVAHIDFLNFTYDPINYRSFNLSNIVEAFVKSFFTNEKTISKRIDQIKKDAKIIIYKYNEKLPNQFIVPGIPYLVLNNLGQGASTQSKPVYIRLDRKVLNKKEHQALTKPLEEFIGIIEKLNSLIGKGNFVYGNNQFENAIIKIARRGELGSIEIDTGADVRTINVTQEVLDLAKRADTLHIRPSGARIRRGSKVKYVDPEKSFFSVRTRKKSTETANAGDLYQYKSPGQVVEVRYKKDANTDEETLEAVKVRSYEIVDGKSTEVDSDWILATEITNVKTESGEAQVAINSIWKANQSTIRTNVSDNLYIEGVEPRVNEKGETVEVNVFRYPSLLRSDSGTTDVSLHTLPLLKSLINFDSEGNHIGSELLPQLRTNVPRKTHEVNFTTDGSNSIDDSKITGRYLQTNFVEVNPTRISVRLGKAQARVVAPAIEAAGQPREEDETPTRRPTKKKDLGTGRRKLSIYDTDRLGLSISEREAKKLVKRLLPGLSEEQIESNVQLVNESRMMKLTGGQKAWGLFVDNMIYLQSEPGDTVRAGVVKHEVAHYVFNNYLNNQERGRFLEFLKKQEPQMNYMTADEQLEFVDEYIADRYQDFERDKGIVSYVKKILRKIARFLGFSMPFIRNIDNFLEAIDEGFFTRPSNEELGVARTLLSVKQHFDGNVQHYLRAKEMMALHVNDFMNPTEPIEEEDGNINYDGIPLTREEAVQRTLYYFEDRLAEYEAEAPTREIDIEEYGMLKSMLQIDGKGRYFVFEETVKDFYPNFRFVKTGNQYQAIEGNQVYEYNYVSEDDYEDGLNDNQLQQDGQEDDLPGNEGWLDNQDTINPFRKASQAVKDFMSTMTVSLDDRIEVIKPGYVFYKLLQNLTGVDVNDLPADNELREEIRQIRDNFISNGMKDVEDSSDRDWVIFDRIRELLNKTERQVNDNGVRLPENAYFKWIGDNQKGHYQFVHNNKTVGSLTEKGKRKTNENFFKDIKKATGYSYDTIKTLYEKEEAAASMNSIYEVINSMRKKYPMFGEYQWEWTRSFDKSRQYLKRKYGAFRDETSLSSSKGLVNNVIESKYDVIDVKFGGKLVNRKSLNQIALAKEIMVDLGLINNPTSVYLPLDKAASLLNTFEAIGKLGKKVGSKKGVDPETGGEVFYNTQDLLSDSRGYVGQIATVIASRQREVGRSSSYVGGDKKPRWFFMNSTQAFDTFRKIIDKRVLRGALTNKGSIFKWNIFNPAGDNKISTIYSIRDHDSMGEAKSTKDPILYSRELSKDFMDRNFMYSFVNFLNTNTSQGLTYLQQFYTISNKPNMLAAQVDILRSEDVRKAISIAIQQEANRTEKGIANYDKNIRKRVTYMPGLEKALAADATQEDIDEATTKVYSTLMSRAEQAFNNYMNLNPTLDDQFGSARSRLLNSKYLDQDTLKDIGDTDMTNMTGTYNYDVLDDESDRKKFKDVAFPVFHLFYTNYFINSVFLNQISSGDQAQYKNEYDEIKRMSMAFAIGYRGRVNEETGLRRTFNVAVVKDFKDVIDSDTIIGRRFKKLFGATYDLTDAQGFATPERVANIRRGFSREANVGATLKPVYFGIDSEGIARGIKYSTIELSNELTSLFPDLARLRYSMTFAKSAYATDPDMIAMFNSYIQGQLTEAERFKYEQIVQDVIDDGNHIDEIVFDSAFKVGKPVTSSDWKRDRALDPSSVVTLTNDNYRHQLNPRHDADAKTRNPSQLTYQVNTNGKNFERQVKLLKLNALMYEHGLSSVTRKMYPSGRIDNAARHQVRRVIAEPLGKVPGNERYAEFMADPEISLNLPNITNKLQQSFLAFMSKKTVEIKHKGSKLVLQSAFGTSGSTILRDMEYHEPRLVFIDRNGVPSYEQGFNEDNIATYYMEVYLPDIYRSSNLSIGDTAWINDPVYSTLLGYRIPSTELHSAVPLRVQGFYPSAYGDNIIIAPKELVVLHGSDFDIDSLYTVNRFVADNDIVYKGKNLSYGGVAVGYKYTFGQTTKISENFAENLAADISEFRVTVDNVGYADEESKKADKQLLAEMEDLLSQAISNEILDTFLDTISSETNIDDMMTPISMAVFNDVQESTSVFAVFANLISQKDTGKSLPEQPKRSAFPSDQMYQSALDTWTDSAMDFIRPKRNLNLVDDELEMHQDNFRAALGTGVAANAFKIISYLYMAANNMNVNTSLREDQQAAPHLKPAYHIEIDGHVYDGFSRYVIMNGVPQSGEGNTERTTTFQIVDSIINAAIDHVKEQILNVVNISAKTINAYLSMIAMGIDPVTTSLFTTQPALREVSNRASDRRAVDNIRHELRQALMLGFSSESYKGRYNDVMTDQKLTPRQRRSKANAISDAYFNEVVKETDYNTIKLTSDALAENFKLNYNPAEMDRSQLLFQLKVLEEFKKVDKLGDYLSKGSRALKSLQQVPSSFANIQNIFDLYNRFFDLDAAIHNSNPNRTTVLEVRKPNDLPFDNVNLETVPNIASSIRVLAAAMDMTGKIFVREGKILVDFSDKLNSYMLDAGIEDVEMQDAEPAVEEYVKQYDKGFLDWNSARSLQRIRENFVEYLLTGVSFDLPDGRRVSMSITEEPPLEYMYKGKEYHEDSETWISIVKKASATGAVAWIRRFIDEGFDVTKSGRKLKMKSLKQIIDQYGIKAEDPNNFVSNLIVNYTGQANTPYIRFGIGSTMDAVEKVDYENEFNNLRNISIYTDEKGNDIEPEVLGADQFNEFQYNLLKYDIIANGLSFGSYSYSQVMSIPIYRQVSKKLDDIMMNDLLDDKKAKYDINSIRDHFAIQLALMNVDKVRSISQHITIDPSTKQPQFGYDEKYDTYYDLLISGFETKGLSQGDLPRFAKRGQTLYVKVQSEKNRVSPDIYYQRVERYNDAKTFSFDRSVLSSGYKIENYFNPSRLSISALEVKHLRGTTYTIEVNPTFEPKVGLIRKDSIILAHTTADYSRMNSSEFRVLDIRRASKYGRDVFNIQLEKITPGSIDNTMNIDKADKSKEIDDTIQNTEC